MGGAFSNAEICQFNKQSFHTKLNVIRDAHAVATFYSDLLLHQNTLPLTLPEYKHYELVESEEYFNGLRNSKVLDLKKPLSKNDKGKGEVQLSYYEFYNYLKDTFKGVYTDSNIKEDDRRDLVTQVFESAYVVQKALIEDLWNDCNVQGGEVKVEKYNSKSPQVPKQPSETSSSV
jgi:hypothetical protein